MSILEWNAAFAVGPQLLLQHHHPETKATLNAANAANTYNIKLPVAAVVRTTHQTANPHAYCFQ